MLQSIYLRKSRLTAPVRNFSLVGGKPESISMAVSVLPLINNRAAFQVANMPSVLQGRHTPLQSYVWLQNNALYDFTKKGEPNGSPFMLLTFAINLSVDGVR